MSNVFSVMFLVIAIASTAYAVTVPVLEKLNTIEQNQIVIANNLKIKLDVISENVCTGKNNNR
ncbi:hypothetical protein K8B83_18920 [Shewanella inventionis]|uniref:hypothetical protein n=1 Tax=Shewanella inventionis TaxID=1738770 RepID=UPI001CBC11AB|nr:hypothetical protein [Shewanella inventionis]UAL42865.1 hypothetical protein K8B83_18920 [Shewanella inventionis]